MTVLDHPRPKTRPDRWQPWMLRFAMIAFLAIAATVIWVSNIWLTERFTETTRNRAELRLAIYASSVTSEIQRLRTVPLLLSRDPVLVRALQANDYTATSQHLISFLEEIGAASILLLDREGRVVAATDRQRIAERRNRDPFFVEATRAPGTVFTSNEPETGRFDFTFSRKIEGADGLLGVILVEIDLRQIVAGWQGASEVVFVTDSRGRIVLSTETRWRGLAEEEALALRSPQNAIQLATERRGNWNFVDPTGGIFGNATIRLESLISFRGWRIVSYTAYASVRERVNGVLALQIMGFALLLTAVFYYRGRRARLQSAALARESAELRRLNIRLQREIAQRQKVERTLEEAEQSLQQSQKLAALGEMSAAVSHELNQPLAAMKTYLAGARILLSRRRVEEAASSFQRIDDLIERMGAITRQLKSYARKGGDALEPVDLREALKGAITMMEPQLRSDTVSITQSLPPRPAMVMADRLRLEQVIINLLRNALDAMKGTEHRELDLIIAVGDEVVLSVRDTGTGIEDLESLFEPFYTTKRAGDGVGLGLAISSGIVNDLGGRLTARNAEQSGAVFELRLPALERASEAFETASVAV